ncbi:hypothetical protein [Streptomyces sp. BE303]|uniref:hypothetical protein n=1 Tax=Streptomyces sp. BE303 TaxID=3002528 RepID=UPI002E79D8C8|nr:hypothetical protein [Streptomyces sp. BE303]MED7952181.1 hypothetical protein [Streptomyces sp. BE303]
MTELGSYGDDAEFLAEFHPRPGDAERVVRAADRLVAENRGRILAGLRRLTGTGVPDLARAMGVDAQVVAALEAGRETSAGAVLTFVRALGGHLVLEVVLAGGRRAGFDLPATASPATAEDFGEWTVRRREAAAAAVARVGAALLFPEAPAAEVRRSLDQPGTAECGGAVVDVLLVAVVDGWRAEIG